MYFTTIECTLYAIFPWCSLIVVMRQTKANDIYIYIFIYNDGDVMLRCEAHPSQAGLHAVDPRILNLEFRGD